ncbi:MAG TPA: sodium-dependent transporter [Victivallales bacterium]|nr:sodium-dependent transporter [Victivallales bacterium]
MPRDGFGTRLGIIAAAAGSAIGLGNIWRFPYITGVNGGSAFILVYLIFVICLGMTGMLAEIIIGRRSQKNVVNAFSTLAPGTPWFLAGVLGIITVSLILAYYIVIFGWTFDYVIKSVMNQFSGMNPSQIKTVYHSSVSGLIKPIIYSIICMGLTAWIVMSGVKNGIERCSKILMPLLFIILIILAIRSVSLEGSGAGIAFLFRPDFSKLTGDAILSALGQALFTLSLGSGIMITYGSYIPKKEKLGGIILQTAILNTSISILAGITIFSAVFAFGIKPGSGPGLVFVTLPNVFQQMTGGYIFAIMFFVLMSLAALTTAISILEVVVAFLVGGFKISRKYATLISAGIITLLSIPCALSFGPMDNFKIYGRTVFALFDYVTANYCNTLASFLFVVFAAWYLGSKQVKDEVTNNGTASASYYPAFIFIIKYISPIVILFVFLKGIGLY